MLGYSQGDALGEAFDGPLEAFVGEWLEASAVFADQVVVVPAAVTQGLVAGDAGAGLDALNDVDLLELFQDAVDAGPGDAAFPSR